MNDVQPKDRSVDVSLNTELRVRYFGSLQPYEELGDCDRDLSRVRLVGAGSETIELQGARLERPHALETWVVAKPREALRANTLYELQIQRGAGSDVCACEDRAWTTISTFGTGTEIDQVPPSFGGVSAVTYGERSRSSLCGETDGIQAAPVLAVPSDASRSVRYNVYVDGAIEDVYVEGLTWSPTSYGIFVDCGTTALATWPRVLPGASLEVRAVDSAGNESAPNAPLEVPAHLCDDPESTDAGASAELDAARGTAPESGPTTLEQRALRDVQSCAFAPGSGVSSGAALCTGLMLLLRRRRVRRRR